MQRLKSTLGIAGVVLATALLAACGGGGGAQPGAIPSGGGSGSNPVTTSGTGTRLTLRIDRATHKRKNAAAGRKRGAKAKPLYVSAYALGLQIAVSTVGANPTTQTIYADISSTSVLCTMTGSVETCTLMLPTLAASEQLVATEVDQKPIDDSVSGYGSAFPSTSQILAATSTPVTTTPGAVTSLVIGLDPVAGGPFYDCGNYVEGSISSSSGNPNFGDLSDDTASGDSRIVVTGGIASSGQVAPEFEDADGGYNDYDTTPLPFADVNASPTPITATSNSSDVTLASVPNAAPTPVPAYAASASFPNDGYEWNSCFFVLDVNVAAGLTAPATIVLDNNLTALNPYTLATYPQTLTYDVVPISASPVTASVSAGSPGTTATITGSDYLAADGMGAESAYNADDGECEGAGTEYAGVSQNGAINTTDWTQAFTVSPVTSGTCTFYLYDEDTQVITNAVTVQVN